MFIALEIIEILILLFAAALCFYLFMEFVYPFFTNGKVKIGWLFFSKFGLKDENQSKDKNENDINSEN